MALSIAQRLQRNDAHIRITRDWLTEHASEDDTTARIRSRTASQRRKLECLTREHEILVSLASPQPQIDAYGAEQHARDFLTIGSLESFPGIERRGEELRRYLWSLLRRSSALRRFQELFAERCHLVIPHITIRRSMPSFTLQRASQRASFKGCIVSPQRIPEKLCEDLQLCDFADLAQNPLGRLQRKAAVIPELKLLWQSAVPLVDHEQRLLVVSPVSEALQKQYPGVKPPSEDIHGSVLYIREVGASGQNWVLK